MTNIVIDCHAPVATVLRDFTNTPDGDSPVGTLVADRQGNLFGVTSWGGATNHGSVFEIRTTGPGTWSPTPVALYSFTGGSEGAMPVAGLIMDSQGNLFGTTAWNGTGNVGTIFELKSTGPDTWSTTLTTLYAFTGGTDGNYPNSALIMDAEGNLFGTTLQGGGASGFGGALFELEATGPGSWATTVTTLHAFANGADGALPCGVIFSHEGDLLGITGAGGSTGEGTIYELKSTGANSWATTIDLT